MTIEPSSILPDNYTLDDLLAHEITSDSIGLRVFNEEGVRTDLINAPFNPKFKDALRCYATSMIERMQHYWQNVKGWDDRQVDIGTTKVMGDIFSFVDAIDQSYFLKQLKEPLGTMTGPLYELVCRVVHQYVPESIDPKVDYVDPQYTALRTFQLRDDFSALGALMGDGILLKGMEMIGNSFSKAIQLKKISGRTFTKSTGEKLKPIKEPGYNRRIHYVSYESGEDFITRMIKHYGSDDFFKGELRDFWLTASFIKALPWTCAEKGEFVWDRARPIYDYEAKLGIVQGPFIVDTGEEVEGVTRKKYYLGVQFPNTSLKARARKAVTSLLMTTQYFRDWATEKHYTRKLEPVKAEIIAEAERLEKWKDANLLLIDTVTSRLEELKQVDERLYAVAIGETDQLEILKKHTQEIDFDSLKSSFESGLEGVGETQLTSGQFLEINDYISSQTVILEDYRRQLSEWSDIIVAFEDQAIDAFTGAYRIDLEKGREAVVLDYVLRKVNELDTCKDHMRRVAELYVDTILQFEKNGLYADEISTLLDSIEIEDNEQLDRIFVEFAASPEVIEKMKYLEERYADISEIISREDPKITIDEDEEIISAFFSVQGRLNTDSELTVNRAIQDYYLFGGGNGEIEKADKEYRTKVKKLYLFGLVHDIGKLLTPWQILHAPRRLDEFETDIVRRHAKYGKRLLEGFGFSKPFIDMAYGHHEGPDGEGYPRGITDIPFANAVGTIIDVLDAIAGAPIDKDRAYQKKKNIPRNYDFALKEIADNSREKPKEGKRTQFVPDIASAFLEVMDDRIIKYYHQLYTSKKHYYGLQLRPGSTVSLSN